MRQQSSVVRLLASAAVAAILAVGLGGCQTTMSDITGSLSPKAETVPDADPRRSVDVYGERYRANPKDADAALLYGQALRATGQRSQAVAVLEQATIAHPGNKALLAGYGRALADNGNFQQGFDVLTRAHSRVRQNLGLVVGLQGRFAEAESIVKADLPAEEAAANVAYLKQMLSRKDSPRNGDGTVPVASLSRPN